MCDPFSFHLSGEKRIILASLKIAKLCTNGDPYSEFQSKNEDISLGDEQLIL